METSQLYNQLRFHIEQPYNINKLSTRHKHPQPVVIEKHGGTSVLQGDKDEPIDKEYKPQFTMVSMEKLEEAQFLVKRNLKKQKAPLVSLWIWISMLSKLFVFCVANYVFAKFV